MTKIKYIFFFFLFLPFCSPAQNAPFQQAEKELINLGKVLLTDSLAVNRIAAAQKIQITLEETLKLKGSYDYPFDSLLSISIQQPEDKRFRIFTWQLYRALNDYQYFGLIQTSGQDPKIIVLHDKSETADMEELPFEVRDKSNWYGALYYNIQSYENQHGKRYLLFGYDALSLFNKRKVTEVLFFEKEEPVFGEATFFPTEEYRPDLAMYRLILPYSSTAMCTLNYDPTLGIILFDNLIEGKTLDGKSAYVPDGSYRAYKLINDKWVHQNKVFDHIWEKPPREQPLFDNKKGKKRKNLFGQ